MYGTDWKGIKYEGTVDFEAIESFYGTETNSKTNAPLICPRGNYNPLKVTSTSQYSEFPLDTNWTKTDKFDL